MKTLLGVALLGLFSLVCTPALAQVGLSDPAYKEGFGKDATGGAGQPICLVTVGSGTGTGTLEACFQPGNTVSNRQIQFAVATAQPYFTRYIGSNVTIDGCANGMNGVTIDAVATDKRALIIQDPASNIIIRCLNFRSTGTPKSSVAEFDLLGLDGTNGGAISNVFLDRLTFMQASDGALDITGNVSNVTVQRSLFYGNAITSLIKYQTRQNISMHHNVLTRNGERNPQVKGDMRLFDFVNNVIYLNDVPNYPDWTPTAPYGSRLYSCGTGCDSPGDVVANLVNNAYLGAGAQIELLTGPGGGSNANVFLGGNLCTPASNCPASPRATANTVPAASVVTTLLPSQLAAQMLPYVGSPNRTALDQQRIDAVAAALPGSPPPPPSQPSISIQRGTGVTITIDGVLVP